MIRKPLDILDIGDESIDWTNVLPLSHYIAKKISRKSRHGIGFDEEKLLSGARRALRWQLDTAPELQGKGDQ